MSVGGQDEQAKAMKRAFEDYDGSIFTSRGRIYERYFEAGYRAALVGSEARERELEHAKDALREATAIFRNVAATGEIRNHATGRRELSPPVSDETRFAAESWLAEHAALAGVVEAEPDGSEQ